MHDCSPMGKCFLQCVKQCILTGTSFKWVVHLQAFAKNDVSNHVCLGQKMVSLVQGRFSILATHL